MLLMPYKEYVVHCRDIDQIEYRWHLDMHPGKKSWQVVNKIIEPGLIFKDHLILSVEELVAPQSSSTFYNSTKKSISKSEFNFASDTLDFIHASSPLYESAYRCHICDGVVANNRCSSCMFDWDD